jgi:hypothetical protein
MYSSVFFESHVWGRREMHTEFWCGTRKETDYLEYLGVDGRIILKWILDIYVCEHGLDSFG